MNDIRPVILNGINGIKEKHFYLTFEQFYQIIFDDNKVTMEDARSYKVMNNEGIQRNVSIERVEDIYQNIIDKKVIQGVYTFIIATFTEPCDQSIRNILVDGQHRLFAMLGLDKEQRSKIEIHLRLINVYDIEEAHKLIEEIGKSQPVAPIGSSVTRKMYNYLECLMKNAINKPRKTKQPHYGNYTMDLLDIARTNKFFNRFETYEQFVRIIDLLNRWLFETRHNKTTQQFMTGDDSKRLSTKTYSTFEQLLSTVSTDKNDLINTNIDTYFCLHLIINYGFMEVAIYLVGMENELKQEITQNYITQMVNNYINRRNPSLFSFNSRINKKVEKVVITNFFGDETTKSCPCCKEQSLHKVERTNWAIGHIKAHSKGGSNRASNLLPICHGCNLSCGTDNLDIYTYNTFNRQLFNK